MTLPLYDSGLASGLLAGVLFGYVLEGGGLASPRKLTAQFRLADWTVFKVMFTAVLVCATGLWLARAGGLIASNSVYMPTAFYWATTAGGLLIGAGFAIGGYCPGTSAAAVGSGRLDALAFIAGMVGGTWLFAAGFGWLEPFYRAAPGPQGETLGQLFGVPDIAVLAGLVIAAFAGWRLGNRFERRLGGPIQAGDAGPTALSSASPEKRNRPHVQAH